MRDRAYSDQVNSQLNKHNSSAIHVVRGPCLRSCVNYGLQRNVSKMLFIYTRFTYEHILSCAKTSRTSNFPTCRKRHRYMKAVIVSIIVLNKGDSDSRKRKSYSQIVTRIAARVAERVPTEVFSQNRNPIRPLPSLDVPLCVPDCTRHRSDQRRYCRGEEVEI